MRKPALRMRERISPSSPRLTASGLMIASVRSKATVISSRNDEAMTQRGNEAMSSSTGVLPLLPKTREHCSHCMESVYQVLAVLRAQVAFVAAHLAPQLALLAT